MRLHPIVAVYTSALLFWMLFFLTKESSASWLIDAERYHVSVHGQLSCRECHDAVFQKTRHPDAGDVNKSLSDFFRPAQCTECHEDVVDDIRQGSHGGKQGGAVHARLDNCIECHDPHEQLAPDGDIKPNNLNRAAETKCSLCHAFRSELPEMPPEDSACLDCHRKRPAGDPETVAQTAAFCFHCHASDPQSGGTSSVGQPLIHPGDYAATPHAAISCLACHTAAAAFKHADQRIGDCGRCHWRHDEKTIGEAHGIVSCGACHLKGVTPRRDARTGQIWWQRSGGANGASIVHDMPPLQGEDSCRRCHFSGNAVGAATMVLPAKSIICMPCHTATFSFGDTTTILSLILFAIGLLGVGSIWFSGGSRPQRPGSHLSIPRAFMTRLGPMLKASLLDGLLQRRLFRASRTRWLVHALVFFPFLFRFAWGVTALVSSLLNPGSPAGWYLLNKNAPLTAFLFDLSGLLIVAGLGIMVLRRMRGGREQVPGLPSPDWPSLALLGAVVIVGFLLEGMRMAMTAGPAVSSWAFAGGLIARPLSGFDLTGVYGYVWYLHAVLTGLFVAWLPFSKMLHMFIAPVVLALNVARHHGGDSRAKGEETPR